VPPEVERQRRPAERWWGEGPRHPRMARATCGWCQSTGCRRMATENRPESYPGRPTCHHVHSCDRDPPGASSPPKSSRGRGPRCGEEDPPPRVRGGSPRCAVERRGGSGGRSSGEAKLLEKKIVLGLRKSGKRLHAGKDGRHTIEARAQAVEEVEHEALIGDAGPEGAESVRHRLHLTAVLVHREIALSKLAKSGLKVQDPSLAVAKELCLKGTPDPVSGIVRHSNDVPKFGREGAMDPGKHHFIHQEPILRRVSDRREDVVGEGVAAEDLQDLVAPPRVLSGVGHENVGDGCPDAGEGRRLSVKRGTKDREGDKVAGEGTKDGEGLKLTPGMEGAAPRATSMPRLTRATLTTSRPVAVRPWSARLGQGLVG
jgi:hypothetical protein